MRMTVKYMPSNNKNNHHASRTRCAWCCCLALIGASILLLTGKGFFLKNKLLLTLINKLNYSMIIAKPNYTKGDLSIQSNDNLIKAQKGEINGYWHQTKW